ncbi:MAG: DUF928 domain-containing protein [Leptolyngbyaceae cyanobacterium MAG.088]|nr:DUF928 domain-containing protein [Leptolyngbyaceae cyanobacterium MAG.088]
MSIRSHFIPASLAILMAAIAGPSYALEFPQTRDRGAPARGPSLATRGEICLDPQNRPSLTSLLPHNAIATAFGNDTDIPMALWFYVPETSATSAELTIVSELGDELYQRTIALPDTPGTIQIDLPRHQVDGVTPAFESGQLYFWDFALICDPDDRGDDILLGGGIQRLDASPDFLAQLDGVADDPLAQAELYASAGVWQETIALAANLRPQNPKAWTELLSSVDLAAIAEKPIVGQSRSLVDIPTPVPTAPNANATTPNDDDSGNLQRLLEGINYRAE